MFVAVLSCVYYDSLLFMYNLQILGYLDVIKDIYWLCYRIRKRIEFLVRDLDEEIIIKTYGES